MALYGIFLESMPFHIESYGIHVGQNHYFHPPRPAGLTHNRDKPICILQSLKLIPGSGGFPGFPGSRGNGVRSRKPDPPKHAQESSDDVSSQQTPSNHFSCFIILEHGWLSVRIGSEMG